MLKFIKKHIAGIVAVVLLAAIVVLSAAAFGPKEKETVTDGGLNDTSATTPTIPDETPEIPTPIYTDTLPKQSKASDTYLYEQIICGNGNIELVEALQTAYATYIIAETDCETGDLAYDKKTVGILRLDFLGNVEKSLPLKNTCKYSYVASCLSGEGIVVAVTDENKSFLYVTVTDYDLTSTKTNVVPYAENAKLFATDDSYVLFCNNAQETFVITPDDGGLTFSTISAGQIVDVFDFGDYLKIFYNASSGYGIIDISKDNLSITKSIFVSSATLNCIVPMVEEGKQLYLAIEDDNGLYVRKYSADLSISSSERKKIGTASVIGKGVDKDALYLCLSGGINGIVTIKPDLTLSYTLNTTSSVITTVCDYCYGQSFAVLALDSEGRLALIHIDDQGATTSYYEVSTGGLIVPYPNGTLGIAYASSYYRYSAIKLVGLK